MTSTKVKAKPKASLIGGQAVQGPQDDFHDFGWDSDVESIPEKDETEERLEKLIFGDEAGFLKSLKHPTSRKDATLVGFQEFQDQELPDEDQKNFEDLPDEELFFLDSGTGTIPTSHIISKTGAGDDEDGTVPTWVDSDDDRITVSLATNTRLRKLRDTEEEDIISGREYIRRLRRQYERLHPTPEWAKQARERVRQGKASGVYNTASGRDSDSDVSMDDDSTIPSTQPLAELLRSGTFLTQTDDVQHRPIKRRKLQPEVVDIQRTKDVTGQGPSSVDTLQFHPYYPLLLSAGPSSTINLHHISPHPPNPNPLLTSLHLKGTPLHTAEFCTSGQIYQKDFEAPDTTRIFMSSRRRYFHTWSLATGNINKVSRPMYGVARADQRTMESFILSHDGQYMGLIGSSRKGGGSINILSTETMQWICSCRIDSRGGVADFAWWHNSKGFTVVGKNGEVSEYDIEKRRIVMKWIDEGAIGTTVIALGGDSGPKDLGSSRWVAIGSSSGIVNVYDRKEYKESDIDDPPDAAGPIVKKPKPVRAFHQLTTPTSHLVFSHDGQMLMMASRWKKDALRLVHLPSCTVYRNWPTSSTPLGRISSLAISPDDRLLAVGNEQGRIRLWEIRE